MAGQLGDQQVAVVDIKGHEMVLLAIVLVLIVLIGVWPNGLLHLSEASVSNLLQQIK